MWVGHTVYLGWRVAAQLAATDIDDLKVMLSTPHPAPYLGPLSRPLSILT